MFIGYPRSGHSLVGALLDAHPDMIVAHELDALKYIEEGIAQGELFDLLLQRSLEFTEVGRKWTEFTYKVENQWHGKYRELKVIGDKKGGRSTLRIGEKPSLLLELRAAMDDSIVIKYIHVIRNPYDNISTMARRIKTANLGVPAIVCLNRAITHYFKHCRIVANVRESTPRELWVDVIQERLIDQPEELLRSLCCSLGVEADKDYLEECAKIVYKSPNKSRFKIPWNETNIKNVSDMAKKYNYLGGYSYDD